jgi:hypothetical protein
MLNKYFETKIKQLCATSFLNWSITDMIIMMIQNWHTHMTVPNFQMVPFLFCYVILIDEWYFASSLGQPENVNKISWAVKMPNICIICHRTSRKFKDINFIPFPKKFEIREKWLKALKLQLTPLLVLVSTKRMQATFKY